MNLPPLWTAILVTWLVLAATCVTLTLALAVWQLLGAF